MPRHEMVSLQGERDGSPVEAESDEPFFPLSLFVSDPEIKKLGLENFQVGEEHELVAKVKVTSVSVSEDEGSDKRTSVTLTLIAGEVNSAHGEDEETRASKVFGG